MREEWRHWYDVFQPEVHECDLQQVYEDGIALLDAYCQPYNKVMGLPFWTTVPEGHVCDISFQMGFVGQQTQCSYHLIRYGEKNQTTRVCPPRILSDTSMLPEFPPLRPPPSGDM